MAHPFPRVAALLAALAAAPASQGLSINWGDAFGGNDTTDTGDAVDASFTFELGTFGSFIPEVSNMADWRANWKAMDISSCNETLRVALSTVTLLHTPEFVGNPAYYTSNFYDGSGSEGPHFFDSEQAYIWIYNDLAVEENSSSQWALFTRLPDWRLSVSSGGEGPAFPLNWYVPDSTESPLGSSSNSPSASFTTQAVPEPLVSVFLAVAGLLVILRRRH